MSKIKIIMAKNRYVSYVVIFPFAFLLTISVFSFFLNFVLPVLVSVFFTKSIYSFFVGHSDSEKWIYSKWRSIKNTTQF